ncbi:MAG: VWA domain-containing protein [Planctomycetota bacterium]
MSENTWDDPRITAYVLGDLDESDRMAFESELNEQTELAAAVEEARGLTDQLKGLYASEEIKPLEADRRQSITEKQTNVVVKNSGRSSKRVVWVSMATAACLLLLVGVPPLLQKIQPDPTISQRSIDGRDSQPSDFARDNQASGAAMSNDASSVEESMTLTDSMAAQGPSEASEKVVDAEDESLSARSLGEVNQDNQSSSRGRQLPSGGRRSLDMGLGGGALNSTDPANAMPGERFGPRGTGSSATPAPFEGSDVDAYTDRPQADSVSPPMPSQAATAPSSPAPAPSSSAEPSAPSSAAPESTRMQLLLRQSESNQDTSRAKSRMRSAAPSSSSPESASPGSASPTDSAPTTEAPPAEAPAPANGPAGEGWFSIGGGGGGRGGGGLGGVRRVVPDARGGRGGRIRESRVDGIRPDGELLPSGAGRGPGMGGDQFDSITENDFRRVVEHHTSTFSIDVDTASYSKVRDILVRAGQLPRPDAVRIEELINYFDYAYEPPSDDAEHPFSVDTVVTGCPWNSDHRLARIALKGKTMAKEDRPPCNLVFLIDTSGSMKSANKLPLVLEGMQMLLKQLTDKDTVSITVYAGSAGQVLEPTPANKLRKIRNALTQLSAGGSTNGGAGIALAYQTARDAFVEDGVNRVILCTDGDFNVGTTSTDALVNLVEEEAKGGIFLSVLGFGMGNHNDSMLEQISGRGNGNYAFIDSPLEAQKVLVEQTSGTLVTIAKDVKIQIEFNPRQVSAYRLIGYENRMLAKEDFKDDTKDAGEIGAGHCVTALYEVVPAGVEVESTAPEVDALRYQTKPELTDAANSNELMKLTLRYKQPDGDKSQPVEFLVVDDDERYETSSDDVRFAAAVAGFGMQLRRSKHAGSWTIDDVLEAAQSAKGSDESGLRYEFIELVKIAKRLL